MISDNHKKYLYKKGVLTLTDKSRYIYDEKVFVVLDVYKQKLKFYDNTDEHKYCDQLKLNGEVSVEESKAQEFIIILKQHLYYVFKTESESETKEWISYI